MNKKHTVIALIPLFVIGSFFNFYLNNLVMESISQKDTPDFLLKLTPSLAGIFIACEFLLAIFFVYRLFIHPTHKKRMLRVYGITLASMSLVGLVMAILAGVLVYHSFTPNSPFPGYLILVMIWHILMIGLGLFSAIFAPKKFIKEEDVILHKTKVGYVFLTILLSLVGFFVMNRLGAVLWSPSYIQWRTFGSTWTFYASLLLLALLVVNLFLYRINVYHKKTCAVAGTSITAVISGLLIITFIMTLVRGAQDPAYVSAISPAVPIERLLAKPYDMILEGIVVVLVATYALVYAIRYQKKRCTEGDDLLSIIIENTNREEEAMKEAVKQAATIDELIASNVEDNPNKGVKLRKPKFDAHKKKKSVANKPATKPAKKVTKAPKQKTVKKPVKKPVNKKKASKKVAKKTNKK